MSSISSSSRSSSSIELNRNISKRNMHCCDSGNSTTFDLSRQCFKSIKPDTTSTFDFNLRKQSYENGSTATFDLNRECFKNGSLTALDSNPLYCGDVTRPKFEVMNEMGDSQCSFIAVSENTISNSDSTSTLRATSTFSSKCGGDSTSLETLGFYDDDWNGNYEVLYEWIDQMDFVKHQKNVHRDFSDGVLMAELLKKLWPKLVDLHNYSPANSFVNKLANWTTLNSKVLRKLKLGQSNKTLQDLAKAEQGVLETLLAKIKKKHETSKLKVTPPGSVTSEETSSIVLNGQKIHKDQFSSMLTKCKQLQEDLAEGDEVIKILKNKVSVSHLEGLLAIKDGIIRNLQRELSHYKSRSDIVTPPPSELSLPSPQSEARLPGSASSLGTAESLKECFSN